MSGSFGSRWLALAVAVATLALAPAALADEFPRDGATAMAYYEADVDRWLDGPVQYIALPEERRAYDQLGGDAERIAFIAWFWARRDSDARSEGNVFREQFYARVAEANARYHDFPRGWRSDRGLVHVVLGRPDAVRPQFGVRAEATTWTYYTVGPKARERHFGTVLGELTIAFVRTPDRGGYQIYGSFAGVGDMPLYVREAIDYSIHAAVVDPDLELGATS